MDLWNKRRQWEMKSDALTEAIQTLERADDKMMDMATAFANARSNGEISEAQWKDEKLCRLCGVGAKLLAVLKPGDVLLTPKLDRIFRSALDALDVLAQLQKVGIALHMIDLGGDVTGNGISKLVFTILSAVAEAERDRIRERIRDVKTDQRSRNRYLGGKVPFGWTVDAGGALIPNEEQQQAIAHMKELRSAGRSLRSIAATLAADSFDLSHAGVKKILLSAGH